MTITIIDTIYGWNDNGHIRPMFPGQECEVDEDEAQRLVDMGVAAVPGSGSTEDGKSSEPSEDGAESGSGGTEDEEPEDEDDDDDGSDIATASVAPDDSIPEYSTDLTAAQLRELLDEYGISYKSGMTKAELVALLDDYFYAEADEDGPDLSAEAPVV